MGGLNKVVTILVGGATMVGLWSQPALAQITIAVRNDANLLGGATILKKFRAGFVGDGSGERIVFRGTVRDTSGSIQGVFRSDDTGSGSSIAERDGVAPGGSTYRNFLQPSINGTGDVAWYGFLGDGRSGIFRIVGGDPSASRRVFDTGAIAPISPGTYQFTDFDAPEITESGGVVFWGEAESTMSSTRVEGVFICEGGNGDCVAGTAAPFTLASTGDAIPGGGGRSVCEFDRAVRASTYGVAFRAQTRMNCNSLTEASLEGVFRIDFSGANGLELIALAGEVTDLGSVATYQLFREAPTIEDDGLVAFTANLSSGPVNEGVFLCDPADGCPGVAAESIVRKSDIVPIVNDELRNFAAPQIADNGDVVFTARPRAGTGRGPSIYIRRYASGTIERIVTGSSFGPLGTIFKRIGAHHTSPSGTVIFRGTVSGAATWKTGLFLWQ
jgi:hypothetical protein